ncbi:MAG: hypothetical protein QF752_13275 [Planctomycetota bacterium]|nr:hypothetical protein [Planctomycetota bacterium]
MTTTSQRTPEIPQPTWKRLGFPSLLATALLEGVTLLFRFGFDLQSTRDTANTIGSWTGGVRIHHGYIGVAVFCVAALTQRYPRIYDWLWILAFSLIASDLIHHFLVLWPLTGSPHFDLTYPS